MVRSVVSFWKSANMHFLKVLSVGIVLLWLAVLPSIENLLPKGVRTTLANFFAYMLGGRGGNSVYQENLLNIYGDRPGAVGGLNHFYCLNYPD